MANKQVRTLINAARFPCLYSNFGRSILDSNDLNARMPASFYGSQENVEYGVPQMIFCENVIPTAGGISSFSFSTKAAAYTGLPTFFDRAIILRDVNENVKLMSPAYGSNMLYDVETMTWTPSAGAAYINVDLITKAYVNGRTFVCYEKLQVYEYNATTNTLDPVTLVLPPGFDMSRIRGIGGASNYLLLFADIDVLWCTPENILDFTDIERGAGNQIPTDLEGRITSLLPIEGGFMIYGAKNAVAATFTNNAAAPFFFKKVPNAGGTPNASRATGSVDGGHFIWSSSGLQRVTRNGAENFAPEVSDFLSGFVSERWNPTTKTVDLITQLDAFQVKLNYLMDRYLFISYGTARNSFDAAFIFDTALSRWGKLVKPHTDIFDYPAATVTGNLVYEDLVGTYRDLGAVTYADLEAVRINVTAPRQGISLLQEDGTIVLVQFSTLDVTAESVAIFGHFQQDRNSLVTFLDIETEHHRDTPAGTISVLLSENGADRSSVVTPVVVSTTPVFRKYDCRCTGMNGDIALEGAFTLTGLLVRIMRHGSR